MGGPPAGREPALGRHSQLASPFGAIAGSPPTAWGAEHGAGTATNLAYRGSVNASGDKCVAAGSGYSLADQLAAMRSDPLPPCRGTWDRAGVQQRLASTLSRRRSRESRFKLRN